VPVRLQSSRKPRRHRQRSLASALRRPDDPTPDRSPNGHFAGDEIHVSPFQSNDLAHAKSRLGTEQEHGATVRVVLDGFEQSLEFLERQKIELLRGNFQELDLGNRGDGFRFVRVAQDLAETRQ
jgi:hypothetical protein